MDISALEKESYIDFSGKISAVVFTPSCNYECPACHAKYILRKSWDENVLKEEKELFDYLDSNEGWVEGVVLCGGEPTLEDDLIQFTKKIKERGLAVKLDTNGSNPQVLKELLDKNLVDYVAMDVKGPKYLYSSIVGKNVDTKKVEESMKLLEGKNYEFRTTVSPILVGQIVRFMNVEEALETAKWIIETTGNNSHNYYLQKFVPRESGLINSRFESFPETPYPLLQDMKEKIIKYLPNCRIR